MFRVADFEGLQCENVTFQNDKGQNLAGYLYYYDDGMPKKGVVVLGHGFGGGGQNGYMPCMNYFAKHGYYGFAYDATGNDNSDGYGVVGLPQQISDMDKAITYVENDERMKSLPIMLFGHSWGGYCVCNVLNYHPEVKAVIECSGFNSSSDMFESGGKSQAGDVIYAMTPFIKIHERFKYGKYASSTAMDGFEKTDASILVLHSADDNVIGIEYGYDKYYEKYKDDPRFTFIRFEDRGHNGVFNDPDNTYKDEFNAEFDKWLESLDYDYNAEENEERFKQDKAKYITENLDHQKWSTRLDEELFIRFLEFYDSAIK